MARELRTDQRKRFAQIIEVLRRNEISKGITPDKLAAIMEELGPTFIKLGQILSMRSDFLPQEYCNALVHLQTHVEPMPFEQVKSILEDAFGRPLQDVFSFLNRQRLEARPSRRFTRRSCHQEKKWLSRYSGKGSMRL